MALGPLAAMRDEARVRPAYEDHAKPKNVSLPVMIAIGAAALLAPVAMQLIKHRRQDRSAGGRDKSAARPKTLADLRALRARAAEERQQGAPAGSAGQSALTPLGLTLSIAWKVDALEKEAKELIQRVTQAGSLSQQDEKEVFLHTEELQKVQLELDGVQGNESVRPVKKAQTRRIQTLLEQLDGLNQVKGLTPDGASGSEKDASGE